MYSGVTIYAYFLWFSRYYDLLVENLHFFAILPTPVFFEALKPSPGTYDMRDVDATDVMVCLVH